MDWRDVSEYPKEEPEVLFWVNDGFEPYPVYGVLTQLGNDDKRRVWDGLDRGFGTEDQVIAWTYFQPPSKH